jgi:hypothetical protein
MATRRDPLALGIALALALGLSAVAARWVWRQESSLAARPPGGATTATWEWARLPRATTPWLEETGSAARVSGARAPRIVEVEGRLVSLASRPAESAPPLGDVPIPPRPLPGQAPDPERLERAVRILGPARRFDRVGEYALHTDVENAALIYRLSRFAGSLEAIYSDRYGLELVGRPAEAVVLYRREEDYRRLEQSEERIAGIGSTGYTRRGIVALYQGDRPLEEIAGTLVHELAHLLNRRGLGPALPPWLDEGIADDLAQSEISETNALLPGTLGGTVSRSGGRIDLRGARASLLLLQRAAETDTALPLSLLLQQGWDDFVGAERETLYAGSLFWVRYLLAGEGGALAPGFRAFLRGIAEGRPATPEELSLRLGRSWPHLELGYRVWLRSLDPLESDQPAP